MTNAEEITQFGTSTWVHAEAPSKHEVDVLCREYQLRERFVRDALDRDEIPRVETAGDYTYIITRFAFQTETGSIETAPILFAISQERLVTVSLEKLPSLKDIMPEEAQDGDSNDPSHLMLLILLRIDADYDRFIHDSSKQIRHLLERLGARDVGPRSFIRFVHIEDDMNDFLSSLVPTNAALRHLLKDEIVSGLTARHELVDTVILNNEQSIQTCEANLKALASIRRTYTLINGYNLDRTIKILTMVSVFIAIPTMFFSFYGMNVPLPWQHDLLTYAGLLFLCLIIVCTAYLFGRKKRIF